MINAPLSRSESGPLQPEVKPNNMSTAKITIFEKAGVHIYDHSGDVFYVGRNWICVHTIQAGEKHIELPFDARVIDPATDEILYRSTRTIDFDMEVNSTVIFRVEPLS